MRRKYVWFLCLKGDWEGMNGGEDEGENKKRTGENKQMPKVNENRFIHSLNQTLERSHSPVIVSHSFYSSPKFLYTRSLIPTPSHVFTHPSHLFTLCTCFSPSSNLFPPFHSRTPTHPHSTTTKRNIYTSRSTMLVSIVRCVWSC